MPRSPEWFKERYAPDSEITKWVYDHLPRWKKSVADAEKTNDRDILDRKLESIGYFEGGSVYDYLRYAEKNDMVTKRKNMLLHEACNSGMFTTESELHCYEELLMEKLSKAVHEDGMDITNYTPEMPARVKTHVEMAQEHLQTIAPEVCEVA